MERYIERETLKARLDADGPMTSNANHAAGG